MPVSPKEVREHVPIQLYLDAIDKKLLDSENLNVYSYAQYYEFILEGELNGAQKRAIIDAYRAVGWPEVSITNSSESSTITGLFTIKLYKV